MWGGERSPLPLRGKNNYFFMSSYLKVILKGGFKGEAPLTKKKRKNCFNSKNKNKKKVEGFVRIFSISILIYFCVNFYIHIFKNRLAKRVLIFKKIFVYLIPYLYSPFLKTRWKKRRLQAQLFQNFYAYRILSCHPC